MEPEFLSAVAASVAAVIALAALYFTRIQAKTAIAQTQLQQKIREDAAQPYVWADIRVDERSGQVLQFVVKNEGPTVATDVQLDIAPPLCADWMIRGKSEQYGPSTQQNKFSSIAPGRQMVWNLASGFGFIDSKDAKVFTVKVQATGPYGPVEQTFVLNVDDYIGVAAIGQGTLLGVQRAVETVTKAIKRNPRA